MVPTYTPLVSLIVLLGDLALLEGVLSAGWYDVDDVDGGGTSPLHLAALLWDWKAAEMLIRAGADPNLKAGAKRFLAGTEDHVIYQRYEKFDTALHFAALTVEGHCGGGLRDLESVQRHLRGHMQRDL